MSPENKGDSLMYVSAGMAEGAFLSEMKGY